MFSFIKAVEKKGGEGNGKEEDFRRIETVEQKATRGYYE